MGRDLDPLGVNPVVLDIDGREVEPGQGQCRQVFLQPRHGHPQIDECAQRHVAADA
jgi:hypothetical protein